MNSPQPIDHDPVQPRENPPAFNIPKPVLVLSVALILIHAVRTYLLSEDQDWWVINAFSFVPVFYQVDPSKLMVPLSIYWSPVSHGLLHGDWMHLLFNLIWLAAFGSAVAKRFETVPFIAFIVLSTAAGALAHFAFHSADNAPVIGASGAVSACMGAAIRFAFSPGRRVGDAVNAPALSLIQSLSSPNILIFLVVWFGLNWLFGAGIIDLGVGGAIAWEAHMGGFLFGWLFFSAFDGGRGTLARK